MAAKAIASTAPEARVSQVDALPAEDMFFIVVPQSTYRAISDAAMQRGLTFSQALQQSFQQWVGSTTKGPQLLTEKETIP